MILLLVVLAVYAVVTIPYDQAVALWKGGDNVWLETPRNARPAWFNFFYREKRPVTIVRRTTDEDATKTNIDLGGGVILSDMVLEFDFNYDDFPTELAIFFTSKYQAARPNVTVNWVTPDGREIPLGEMTIRASESFRVSQDSRLVRRLGGRNPEVGLFADPDNPSKPLKGTYRLVVEGLMFEEGSDVDASLVVYGQLHGLAGTDHLRRDIMVALLWGAPVALAFGLVAAVGSSIATMTLAAASVWFGGWVDWLIRRINEIVMILPSPAHPDHGRLVLLPQHLGRLGRCHPAGYLWLEYPYVPLHVPAGKAIWLHRSSLGLRGRQRQDYLPLHDPPRFSPCWIPGFVTQVPSFVFLGGHLVRAGLG